MKRKLLALAAASVLVLTLGGPALAVTNGTPDGDGHPYVGLLVFDTLVGGQSTPTWRCTGALLSPTVVLTAGHCTDGAVAARYWADKDVTYDHYPPPLYPYGGTGSGSVEGTPYTFPGYQSLFAHGLPGFSFGDVGVVVLSQPIIVARYAQLPAAGVVETLANKTALDFVGYGVSEQVMAYPGESPRARWTGPRIRNYAPGELIAGNFAISDDVIKVTMNPGGGKGGTCFGDSGGPDLLGGTDTVLAVNSFVTNVNCTGVGYDTRVDTPERLAWIGAFLGTASACTFTAADSAYYNTPTADPAQLYGTGPVSFTWGVLSGVVTGGHWDEIVPPVSGTTYLNVVDGGTVTAGIVSIHFTRSVPNAYAFSAGGTLSGPVSAASFMGWADGTQYLWTATGTVTCH